MASTPSRRRTCRAPCTRGSATGTRWRRTSTSRSSTASRAANVSAATSSARLSPWTRPWTSPPRKRATRSGDRSFGRSRRAARPAPGSMEAPQLGRYVIQSELGRGAMGVVYKATDSVLQRTVAVKTVNMALESTGIGNYEARFYQEARAAGSLNHANIVTVYDVGKAGDIAYMAMEFIEGVELRTMIGEGRSLPVAQAISIGAQVAEGLGYAHQHGVVHRDIKPANIMVVANGPVKITDFGIARMRASGELTQTGMMLGSPKYMSPEQVIGKRADYRSDIFSLGIILYEMLCGNVPFNGENVTALMYQIVNFAPPAPSAVNHAVPELLDYIVAKMLAKPLEERYQGAQELAQDLRECERQLAAPPGSTVPPRPTGLASGPQPELVDTRAHDVVMAQTLNRTRDKDKTPEDPTTPPARGLSHSFDSLEATQRLAVLTGAAWGLRAGCSSRRAQWQGWRSPRWRSRRYSDRPPRGCCPWACPICRFTRASMRCRPFSSSSLALSPQAFRHSPPGTCAPAKGSRPDCNACATTLSSPAWPRCWSPTTRISSWSRGRRWRCPRSFSSQAITGTPRFGAPATCISSLRTSGQSRSCCASARCRRAPATTRSTQCVGSSSRRAGRRSLSCLRSPASAPRPASCPCMCGCPRRTRRRLRRSRR